MSANDTTSATDARLLARYQIALAVLMIALALAALECHIQRGLAALHARRAVRAYAEAQAERDRADAAEARVDKVERGAVLPQGARYAVAQEVADGGTILPTAFDGVTPQVKPSLPDAAAREAVIGGTGAAAWRDRR